MARDYSWFFGVALLMVSGLLLTLGVGQTLAQGVKKSDAVVKTEAKASKPANDGTQQVTVTLTIDKDWHIYANPVGYEDLVSSQTTVAITSKGKLKSVKVDYPKGQVIKDQTLDAEYKVYEEEVVIKAKVQRVVGNTHPLEVAVKFQACDAKRCLLPATVKFTLP
jgi:hypothetical protein